MLILYSLERQNVYQGHDVPLCDFHPLWQSRGSTGEQKTRYGITRVTEGRWQGHVLRSQGQKVIVVHIAITRPDDNDTLQDRHYCIILYDSTATA